MNTATGLIKFIKLRVLKEEFKDTKAVISIRKFSEHDAFLVYPSSVTRHVKQ
jgi:hypothetical protein